MSFTKDTHTKIEDLNINQTDEQKLIMEAAARDQIRKDSALYQRLVLQSKSLRAKSLKDWKVAIASASNAQYCERGALQELYENMMLDNHLSSVIDSRILFAQRSVFKIVNDQDEENIDLTFMLEKPWFDDLIYKVIYSRFQGCTLLEMYTLNADGELESIEEIPQSHFNPYKGIIVKEPGDEKGWPYRERPFDTHYVQIGKTQDLGMLEKLGPIVLAKKLALGSYQDYIEKFGIPPIFITTDREDDTRLNQLFTAAQNFKSNHFMVGRGQEKFTIGNTEHGSVIPFDMLITRANDEMSKRILGGAGLTDEKSYVGSTEIQYKLAKDRFESDKMYFKYIFNALIKPRLVAMSPAYKAFENHYFEWDNTESMSVKDIIDAVNVLGNRFEIDPEYVERITGIPILKQRDPTDSGIQPAPTAYSKDVRRPVGGEGEKKQIGADAKTADAHLEHLKAFYPTYPELQAADLSDWASLIRQMGKDLNEGKLQLGDINHDYVQRTYDELNRGAAKGYGKGWSVSHDESLPDPVVRKMKRNLYKFAAAKNTAALEQINRLMYDGDRLRTYDEFKNELDKLNITYNKNWLQAEYQTAKQSGEMAQYWKDIQGNKELYPNLKYKTQEDDRVRNEHANLNDIIRPVDDPFWDEAFPPNGWRCRCYVVQTAEDSTEDKNMPVITDKDIRPEFRMNVGKGGQVFMEDSSTGHRFFALAENTPGWKRKFELSKLNAGYEKVKTPDKNTVKVSIYADDKDLKDNLKSAMKIADILKLNVAIRPDVDTNVLTGYKNPEYLINDKIADLKINFKDGNYKGINSAFKSAKKQGLSIIVFDFTKSFPDGLNIYEINRYILSNVNKNRGKQYEELIFIYKEKAIKVSRETMVNKKLLQELEKIKG